LRVKGILIAFLQFFPFLYAMAGGLGCKGNSFRECNPYGNNLLEAKFKEAEAIKKAKSKLVDRYIYTLSETADISYIKNKKEKPIIAKGYIDTIKSNLKNKNRAPIKKGEDYIKVVKNSLKQKSNIIDYKVQKDDTLSLIAKVFNTTTKKLRELNNLKDDKIVVGKVIKVPGNKAMLAQVQKKKEEILKRVKKSLKLKLAKNLKFKRKIRVIATAYTSHVNQTDSTPFLAAWNNRIRPGMKIIAVSTDLIKKYGLKNGVKVKISGLPGYYVVRDKMNPRLRNHIDIYMGVNKKKALKWGRRRVTLYW